MEASLDLLLVHPDRAMCTAWDASFRGLPRVTVVEGLLDDLPPHDCFVTAANSFGLMTAGIDAAVVEFHGAGLMERLQRRILTEYLGEQPVGTCLIEATGTPGYPFVAHTPTMRVPKPVDGTDAVYVATWAALVEIQRFNASSNGAIRSVAMPAMGTGFGNVAFGEAARQMALAYENALAPPERLDWDVVRARHRALCFDGDTRLVD